MLVRYWYKCHQKKKKIKSNSKNIEISKKYTQVKQELLLVIKMGLKLKLGYKSVESLSAILKIDSLKLLERIVFQIPQFSQNMSCKNYIINS